MNVRHARRFVGVVLAAGLAYVAWLLAGVHRPPTRADIGDAGASGPLPPAAEESGCFDDFVLDWSGDHLEAGRACKQADGSSQLEGGVLITLEDETGREEVTIRAERGILPAQESLPVELIGSVEVETPGPDPLTLESESLSILKEQKLVRSVHPVTFAQGEVSGRAGTLEHAWETRVTVLAGDPVVRIQGDRTSGRVVTLNGKRIERRDATHAVLLVGEARIDFGDGSVEGRQVDVLLSDDGQQVRRVDARGAARTTTRVAAPAGGGPAMARILQAERIVHGFEGASRLRAVDATVGASLQGRPTSGAGPVEDLEGDDVRLEFAATDPPRLLAVRAHGVPARFERTDETGTRRAVGADLAALLGSTGSLEKLTAAGAAHLEDETARGRKVLDANQAELRLDPEGRFVRELDFEGTAGAPARLSEERVAPGGGGGARTVVAGKGHLVLDDQGLPTGGSLDGGVDMREPGSRARADRAEFSGPPQITTLRGRASVEQGGKISHGDRIVRDEAAGTLLVEGTQHTIIRDATDLPGMEAAAPGDDPVYISSNELVLAEQARRATYSGGRPSLRRGDTELVADDIVIDDREGTLDASGSVESRLRLINPEGAQQDPGALFDPTKVVHGTSREFHYRRKDSVVVYAGDVKLEQEDAVLTADRVEIGLETGSGRVKWLVAEGSALFDSPDRDAEGERLEHRAEDGSVRVEGGRRPARARDSKGQFVSGGVLLFGADGAVRVVSPAAGRTRGAAPVVPAPAGS